MTIDFSKISAERDSLKTKLSEFDQLKTENLDLKSRAEVYTAQIKDLAQRNDSLMKTIDTFSKPKAAVNAILANQIFHKDVQYGIGFETSSSMCTDASITEKKDTKAENNSINSLHKDTKPKYNAVAIKYPKYKDMEKNRYVQKGIKIADNDSADEGIHSKYISKASLANLDSAADEQSPSVVIGKGNQKGKKKVPMFVPAYSPKSNDAMTKSGGVLPTSQSTSKVRCDSCLDYGHQAHECLLKSLSGPQWLTPLVAERYGSPRGTNLLVPLNKGDHKHV